MEDKNRKIIVDELVSLINKGNAHAAFEDTVENVSLDLLNKMPDGLPYSVWQMTEHIRITQWDIVEFCIDANHKSPKWPEEYWPEKEEIKITEEQWQNSLKQIAADRKRFIDLLNDPATDLYTPFSHGSGQNLLREALLIADHTSYHTGQIIVIRRLLNDWE